MSYPIKFPVQAVLVPAKSIDTSDRIRTTYTGLDSLADSIKTNGLIHPPVINSHNKLIAGGRRFKAMTENLGLVEIPVIYLETINDTHLRILEVEENVRREPVSWQDTCVAVKRIHTSHTIDALIDSKQWTKDMTADLLGRSQADVSNCITLATAIEAGDTDILNAVSMTDGLRILLQRRENEVMRAIATSSIPTFTGAPITTSASNPNPGFFQTAKDVLGSFGANLIGDRTTPTADVIQVPLSQMIYCADSITWMAEHPACCDHIVTDIPYGIDMANLQQDNTGMDVSATAAEHDVTENIKLMDTMFPRMFSCMKETGFAILWCDISHWARLTFQAEAAGFRVQRWPLIWFKTSTCMNQAAAFNFTKNFEIALVLSKGAARLVTPQTSSVWVGPNDGKDTYGHPFAKPTALWLWLYSAISIRGQTVLDPFAGSGSACCAAVNAGLTPLGVELNKEHYSRLYLNLSTLYKTTLKNCVFV